MLSRPNLTQTQFVYLFLFLGEKLLYYVDFLHSFSHSVTRSLNPPVFQFKSLYLTWRLLKLKYRCFLYRDIYSDIYIFISRLFQDIGGYKNESSDTVFHASVYRETTECRLNMYIHVMWIYCPCFSCRLIVNLYFTLSRLNVFLIHNIHS